MKRMFVSCPFPNSCVETLIPNVIVFGDGAFGREFVNDGGALLMGLV